MTRAERLQQMLTLALAPVLLEVVDDSAQHAHHAGAREGGQTHYSVLVVSEAFAGQSRVERSRRVHALLEGEFGSGLHALSLTLRTPGEESKARGFAP